MLARNVVIVSSLTLSLVAKAQTQATQFRLTEEVRIDGTAESLNSFLAVLIGADGRVVIPQRTEGQFLFYDNRGRRLGVFGRKGQGPGEFDVQGMPQLGWRGDTLWIHDFNQRRVTLVSRDLKLVRVEHLIDAPKIARPPGTNGHGPPRNLYTHVVYPDNSQLAEYPFGAPDPKSGVLTDNRYVVVGPTGDIVREIARIAPSTHFVGIKGPWGLATANVPFASQSLRAVSPDGRRVVLASQATFVRAQGSYRLTAIRSTGDTIFSRVFLFTPVSIPARAKAEAVDAMLRRGQTRPTEGPDAGPWPTQELAAMVRPLIPAYYAPLLDIRPGHDDSTWLWVYDAGPNARYRMIDGQGNIRGDVVLPPRSAFAAGTTSRIWLREYDQDNVPSLVRYRISR